MNRTALAVVLLLGAAAFVVVLLSPGSGPSWATAPWRASSLSFFNLEEGITMASFAAASYCPSATLTNWTCYRCTSARVEGFIPHAVVYDDSWNLQAYVGYSPPDLLSRDGAILVVFRGTIEKSLENWVHNLMASTTRVKYPNMPDDATVHDGFYRSWTRSVLQKEVNAAIQAVQAERGAHVPVVVVGHSLGGALATLCAAELVTTYRLTAVKLYTFGCPRVGNVHFAKALQNVTTLVNTRVTHDRDIVPSVPFRHLGFHHAAREVFQKTIRIGRSPLVVSVETSCDAKDGEDERCQNSLCKTPGGCTSVADHLEYLDVPLGGRKGFDC